MRLIDADAMRARATNDWAKHEERGTLYTTCFYIDTQPTIDAKEVKHGKWIETMLDKYKKVECKCSVCGWSGVDNYDSYVDIATFDYCPYCGARMDGDE